MLQKSAIMLLSKIVFRDWLTTILLLRHGPEQSVAFSRGSMLSGSALVLLDLLEASSTSSPSLETVVNLVPEAKLSHRLLVLQPGSLRSAICSYRVTSSGNCTCAIRTGLKITEFCRHNARCFEGSIMLEIMPA